MSFDIRLPIGLLFLAVGVLLCVWGLSTAPDIYRSHSLGVNINLVWGAAMAVFGLVMLGLSLMSRQTPQGEPR